MRIAIVSYGMGNLASVAHALTDLGARPFVAEQPAALAEADRIVLPGVGAFGEGMARLRDGGWVEPLHRRVADGTPLLGICLGMQMLATRGEEGGDNAGLGFIDGRVRRLDALGCTLRIPHVGWNDLQIRRDGGLLQGIPSGSDFYFVHSFAFVPATADELVAVTDYGIEVAAVVRRGHVFGTQFHPEKSSRAGRRLLRNFLEHAPC